MRVSRRSISIAFLAFVAFVNCGGNHDTARVVIKPAPSIGYEQRAHVMPTTTTTTLPASDRWYLAVRWIGQANKNAAAAATRMKGRDSRPHSPQGRGPDTPAAAVASSDIHIGSPLAVSNERCQYAPTIRQVWQRDAEWAVGIAYRESNCRPDVASGERARGIFQLLGHVDDQCAFDAYCNITAAWHLYEQCGRWPWTAPNYGCVKP